MKLSVRTYALNLVNPWKIASSSGSIRHEVVLFELNDSDGVVGIGEAAPASTYHETATDVVEACKQLDASKLSFREIEGALALLRALNEVPVAARCGLEMAFLDGATKLEGKAVYDHFGLGFRENHHLTSFSIGIDRPEIIAQKVSAAADFPVLKLKVGDKFDRENLASLRSIALTKPVRLDANEAWKTKELALAELEALAAYGNVQFVEQPMPRNASDADLTWLKERSPLPLYADESCHTVGDIPRCAECFHGINVKLVKTGGLTMAFETLRSARKAGLKTMIGCMIETSLAITAAAHLAELADHLDLDGNLLISNDPFAGVTVKHGILSFSDAVEKTGLRVS